jgi:Homeodomain-like domain-containing protein
MTNSVQLRVLTRNERRVLAAKLNERPLRVRVHRRYRVIAEVARGRPVVEVADRAGCHLSMAYEWIHRFNASGFTTFAQAPQSEGATEAEALTSFHEQGLAPEAGRAIYSWYVTKGVANGGTFTQDDAEEFRALATKPGLSKDFVRAADRVGEGE